MAIQFHQTSKEFHVYNEQISYIIKVLENGQLGHVYFGKHLTDREDFGYLVEYATRDMAPYPFEGRRRSICFKRHQLFQKIDFNHVNISPFYYSFQL